MLKYPRNITVDRINNFMHKGQWEDVNLQSFLIQKTSTAAVHLQKYSVKGLARITFEEAMKGDYVDAQVGCQLSPTWSTHWFKVEITVPEDFKDQKVYLIFDPDCEAMVWSKDGETLMGITGGNGGDRHVDFDLLDKAKGGEKILLYIEVAANGMFGAGTTTMIGPPNPDRVFTLQKAELVVLNELAQEIYWDLEVISGIATEMSTETQLANDALFIANKIVNTIVAGDQSSLARAKAISKEFFESRQQTGAFIPHEITAIGNCHIDTAWLWPYGETKRKIARSWSTQCRLIEQNPGYTFAASQMQQFEWLEQLYPPLFKKVTKLIKEGRFIPIGGTWVEMDCNLPSGEAFCRQFLYGQRYLKEKFGFYSSVFWLPDTFGYSSQLPQILKSAGLKYFFTQKLSWNNINKFPHTSFYWKGLDGTSVLTHFSPADTYTAQASVKDAVFMVKNNKDKQFSNKSLLLYGNGDGGGGPLKPMLERIKRFGNLADMPAKCAFGNPEAFYQQLEESSKDLNTWQGELYFELHRGTYTSHALVKKYNRKCEFLLREIELLYSQAIASKLLSFEKYPKQELDRLWKLVLLNQFHDCLPGSSIGLVYVDVIEYFEDVIKSGTKLKQEVLAVLISPKSSKNWFYNPSGWVRTNVLVEIKGDGAKDCVQKSVDGNGLALLGSMAPLSWTELSDTKTAPSNPVKGKFNYQFKVDTIDILPTHVEDSDFVLVEAVGNEFVIDNGVIKVVIDTAGRITHYYDLVNKRDVVSQGELANVFKFYEDIPLFWDAWDVEIYHLEKGWDAKAGTVRIEESGPLRVVLRAVHPLSKTSTLDQKIIVTANSDRLVFENDIFWNENRKILKVQFPVAVNNDNATFETQFGILQRPTHNNSSWDIAKFEVCAHKFVDFSEFGYGVALLNDCKYGFSVRGNTIHMSILRAPKAPDDKCDMGRHTFNYAIQPHKGSFLESHVAQHGYEFNTPVIHVEGELGSSLLWNSFFSVDKHNIVLDTIKKSESSNCIVLRLYESMGGRGSVTIKSAFELASVFASNVLEENVEGLAINFGSKEFTLEYKPFQVLTLVCKLK